MLIAVFVTEIVMLHKCVIIIVIIIIIIIIAITIIIIIIIINALNQMKSAHDDQRSSYLFR